MLTITVPAVEQWDEAKQEFIYSKETTLCLEHSLVSISKWEAKFHKAFLTSERRTPDEVIEYVKCMTVTSNVDEKVYKCLTKKNIEDVNNYIADPMTATQIDATASNGGSVRKMTSEMIYYQMVALQIPFECQKWHLNRLSTLIRVCNIKNTPPKKMSQREIMSRNHSLNAARRSRLHSKG